VNLFLWPMRMLGRILTELGKATVAIGRIGEILEHPREAGTAAEASLRTELPGEAPWLGEIAFSEVGFVHADGTRALDGVSFHAPPGATLALLGPSGSGKSSIVQLLLRFYDAQQGRILIDGRSISDLPRKEVRSRIAVVMQEPFLYSKTLRENIRFGRRTATDDEIVEATVTASVHESIAGFEGGYDTLVGERGVTLSGGQRQRVALARALLHRPAVLILDDALSAVDTETESLILEALRERRGRQTTILIAHRLSTLMHADQILVLDEGRIIQRGTHHELARADGLYRRLWRIQSELEENLKETLEPDGDGFTQVAAV
jgi:ATP-binding cassette subfamily B protein